MKTRIIFQLTEAQLKQMVWTVKNYGHSPEEEQDVTPEELAQAKESVMDYLDNIESAVSEVI